MEIDKDKRFFFLHLFFIMFEPLRLLLKHEIPFFKILFWLWVSAAAVPFVQEYN